MNYLEYFGLQMEPFGNTPATKFFYNSAQHSSVLLRLMHVVEGMRGLALVTGQAGVGKTTLARKVLEQLSPELYHSALIVVGHRSDDASWLLRKLARQLGGDHEPETQEAAFAAVQERLEAADADGRRTVVLVDEAQMLGGMAVLEQVRGLLNLERDDRKLVTFVLFGSEDLESLVATDAPLDQRVSARVRLERLSKEGTAHYVRHRLRLAGVGRELFDAATLEAVYLHTRGTPRLINALCDNALLEAFLIGREVVDRMLVGAVATDLGLPGAAQESDAVTPSTKLGEETAAAVAIAAEPSLAPEPDPELESEPELDLELEPEVSAADVDLGVDKGLDVGLEDDISALVEEAAPESEPDVASSDDLDDLMAELEADTGAEDAAEAADEDDILDELLAGVEADDGGPELDAGGDDLDALMAEFTASDDAQDVPVEALEPQVDDDIKIDVAVTGTDDEPDIDALLADLDQGDTASGQNGAEDIDRLLAELDDPSASPAAPQQAKKPAASGDLERDDLDDLLSQIDQLEDV